MRRAEDHTNSYYAATRKHVADYPTLRGEHRCDVVVVGAGFTGISAALHLAERGYDVVIVEANRVGWGASGRNGGQLIDGFVEIDKIEKRFGAEAGALARQMGTECRDIVVQRVDQYEIDCDLKFGYLDLAIKPSEMQDLEEHVEDCERHNYPHALEVIPADRIKEVIGSDRYVGGVMNPGNGHLHPLNLCIGEARAAEMLGARIFERSPVVRLRHGSAPSVEAESGVVHAHKIVLAGNAYLGNTEPRLAGAVIPAGSYVIATEPLSSELARELLPRDSACCDQRVALDYYRLSADRRLLFGGMCNYSGREPKDIAAALRPKMLRVFPQLADARIEYQWGGNIGISINRIPQLGRIQGNTYYAQGYSGHGVAPTHLAGKMIADIVGGDSEQFDLLSRVRHMRLPGGKWFANPALALGMLYYRLKELL